MDNNKGINGRGLAHVMNRARSEFAQKKCVTKVVSILKSEYDYTGVVAKPLTATGFKWQKTADTLYSVDDFVGKTAIRQMHNDIIDKTDIVYDNISIASENGSFFMNAYFVCVYPEDVGKVLNVGTEAIFPEEGTYVWKSTSDWAYCTINIVGTYKRKFESSDQTCEVSCSIDPETLQVDYFDYTFDGIIKAKDLGQFIRLRCWFPDKTDGEIGTQLYASLESYSTDFGFFEFGGIIDADLGDGKQPYYYKVTLSEDNTISTEYTRVGGSVSQEADSSVVWVGCEFNFGNGQAEKFTLEYDDIVQAFNDNKAVKLVATYGSTEEPQHAMGDLIHYREDERVLEFAVFVYANILTEEHTLHHFRIVMDSDGNTVTDITPIGGGADAVSPTVEITQIEGGHRVTITDVNGPESFDVMNGAQGPEGPQGPKGDNYVLTDTDKNNIVQAVIDKLPEAIGTWNGGSY